MITATVTSTQKVVISSLFGDVRGSLAQRKCLEGWRQALDMLWNDRGEPAMGVASGLRSREGSF